MGKGAIKVGMAGSCQWWHWVGLSLVYLFCIVRMY